MNTLLGSIINSVSVDKNKETTLSQTEVIFSSSFLKLIPDSFLEPVLQHHLWLPTERFSIFVETCVQRVCHILLIKHNSGTLVNDPVLNTVAEVCVWFMKCDSSHLRACRCRGNELKQQQPWNHSRCPGLHLGILTSLGSLLQFTSQTCNLAKIQVFYEAWKTKWINKPNTRHLEWICLKIYIFLVYLEICCVIAAKCLAPILELWVIGFNNLASEIIFGAC